MIPRCFATYRNVECYNQDVRRLVMKRLTESTLILDLRSSGKANADHLKYGGPSFQY